MFSPGVHGFLLITELQRHVYTLCCSHTQTNAYMGVGVCSGANTELMLSVLNQGQEGIINQRVDSADPAATSVWKWTSGSQRERMRGE